MAQYLGLQPLACMACALAKTNATGPVAEYFKIIKQLEAFTATSKHDEMGITR
jgi:hypothetical protein